MSTRVRFAPSPTGAMHVGNARCALYNFLWARHTGGQFLLRIEDTDLERSTPENVGLIFETLAWLGITPDAEPTYQSRSQERHLRSEERRVGKERRSRW